MWSHSLWLVAWFTSSLLASELRRPLDCEDLPESIGKACARPIDDIVAVAPGSSYIAKLACKNRPWMQGDDHQKVVKHDQILLLNVTLSHDHRTILLNDKPIYPLPTIPTPPNFRVTQFQPDFSNKNLSAGLACSDPFCLAKISPDCGYWCNKIPRSSLRLNYLYSVDPTEYNGKDKDAHAQYWEIALDVIGGQVASADDTQWNFDDAEQKMLWMLVAGKEAKLEAYKGEKDTKAASDLFGAFGEQDKTYEYQIKDVRLEARLYTFPARRRLGIWQKIGRFFGNDVWQEEDRRFLYLSEEWGYYGKKGTLRNLFGEFVHWDFWPLFWIISSSTIAALVALFGVYKFFFWIVEQRQLSKWDGMDDVWDRLRREPTADEEDALLNGGYRDDPDESGSSRPPAYTDEAQTNKPLPDKPLPDKPLPAVPLIDA